MSKEFVECNKKNGRIPYNASTLCFCLTQYAKEYINENFTKLNNMDIEVRDAVIVDAINYLGAQGWCDFALCTEDLYDNKKHEEKVDAQCLLTTLINHFAYYINKNNSKSVLIKKNINNSEEEIQNTDVAKVIISFTNYISKRNAYDRVFTKQELDKRYKELEYKRELKELKTFLEGNNKYNKMLLNGETIHSIFENMAEEKDLDHISKRGIYYNENGDEKFPWEKKFIDREIYAMAYAFTKLNEENAINGKIDNKIVKSKVREMKRI